MWIFDFIIGLKLVVSPSPWPSGRWGIWELFVINKHQKGDIEALLGTLLSEHSHQVFNKTHGQRSS